MTIKSHEFFDFELGRFAWAFGSHWILVNLADGSSYSKVIGPIYWRTKP